MITPSIERVSSGPTYSMTNLANHLAMSPHLNFNLVTFNFFDTKKDANNLKSYETRFDLLGPKRLGFSLTFIFFLIREIRSNDEIIIYNNSQYFLHSISIFILRAIFKFNLIFSARGSLDEVSLNKTGRVKLKKLLIRPYVRILNFADYMICTSNLEIKSIKKFFPKKDIFLLPNSIDPPNIKEIPKKNKVIYLGRIVPQKGVHDLINAWKRNINSTRNWELQIIGDSSDQNYLNILVDLSKELDNVKFLGEVYGNDKWKLISESKFLVLPSYSENFGNVVIEGMSLGTVPITTNDIPWKELEENDVGFCCAREDLAEVLGNAIMMSEVSFMPLSKRTRQYALNLYHAKNVANKFVDFLINLNIEKDKKSYNK